MSDRAMTIEEAGKRLGIGERTVWKWVRSGVLPSIRLGNSVRISERLIDDVLAGRFIVFSSFYDKDTHENPERLRGYLDMFSKFLAPLEAGDFVSPDLWQRVVDKTLGRWTKQSMMTKDERTGLINVSRQAIKEATRLLQTLGEAT